MDARRSRVSEREPPAFATWVYQAFLPLFWEQYQVTNCMDFDVGDLTCNPPPNGAYMASYSTGGVKTHAMRA